MGLSGDLAFELGGGDVAEIEAKYRDAGIALLPPGRALSKEIGSAIVSLLEAASVECARVHLDAEMLRKNYNPATADELLEVWEEACGLPGSCVTNPPTAVAERQGAVVAKLRGRRSHSQTAFEDAAEAMGYTELEFRKTTPFACGSSCGDALYGDGWANVVFVDVPVGDQTADEALTCAFQDDLRRSHSELIIALEGPMGATRTHTVNYFNEVSLGASTVLADRAAVELKYSGLLSIQAHIHNGSGSASSDTPVGVWRLYVSSDGELFTAWPNASAAEYTAVTAQLDLVNPNGNAVVNEVAVIENVPGKYVKLAYVRSSGGGTDAVATVHLSTW